MTAKELIAHLRKLPPDTRIVTSGYEGGYTDASIPDIKDRSVLRENVNTSWFYGPHELDAPNGKELPASGYAISI